MMRQESQVEMVLVSVAPRARRERGVRSRFSGRKTGIRKPQRDESSLLYKDRLCISISALCLEFL